MTDAAHCRMLKFQIYKAGNHCVLTIKLTPQMETTIVGWDSDSGLIKKCHSGKSVGDVKET